MFDRYELATYYARQTKRLFSSASKARTPITQKLEVRSNAKSYHINVTYELADPASPMMAPPTGAPHSAPSPLMKYRKPLIEVYALVPKMSITVVGNNAL